MEVEEMKNLISWLLTKGYQFRTITMTDGRVGIMIDTDYDGAYPPKEVYRMHDEIIKKVSRLKGLRAESRGFYTAMLVTIK
jgi:hypothetical protein